MVILILIMVVQPTWTLSVSHWSGARRWQQSRRCRRSTSWLDTGTIRSASSNAYPTTAELRGFAYTSAAAQPSSLSSMPAGCGDHAAGGPSTPPSLPPYRPKDERSVTITDRPGGLGVASGLMALQPDATRACIVLHPHPGRGGDMYNPFVGACVTAMRHSGISTLRFNFSTPDGAGDDVEELLSANTNELLAALTMFANAAPQAGIVLVGYSWGAVVALSAARKDAVTSQRTADHRVLPASLSSRHPLVSSLPVCTLGAAILRGGRCCSARATTTSTVKSRSSERLRAARRHPLL